MPAAKKAKMKIRELKPRIKVIGSEEKAAPEEKQKTEETQLEEIITEAPSAGEFPAFRNVQPGESRGRAPEMQTSAATTEAEASSGAKYEIQKDISEAEIRRVYRSRLAEPKRAGAIQSIAVPEIKETRELFRNREIEGLQGEREEDKYAIETDTKTASPRRKLPWQA